MSARLLAIRPEPGLTATLEAGRKLGLDITGTPLFEIRPCEWTAPDPDTIDGLLIGSANAVLHGGEALAKFRGKPVYAVGQTTAETAREAGFTIAAIGQGGLQNVLDTIPAPTRLLRVAGAEHVPLTAPDGVTIHTIIAYESAALPLPSDIADRLGADTIVLLHSAAAARHFASECERLELDRARISLAVLGPRIADSVGTGWRAVHVSPEPNDAALLEMARIASI
ncbi:MAG: uroporphyrinogen-III synthase [Pseudomonadota bacterium]